MQNNSIYTMHIHTTVKYKKAMWKLQKNMLWFASKHQQTEYYNSVFRCLIRYLGVCLAKSFREHINQKNIGSI
jgi:hypothetical protein